MLAYILLICALSGSQRTSAQGQEECKLREATKEVGKILEEGIYKQIECDGLAVPKDEGNCNLTCFRDGVNKYRGKTKNKILRSFVKNFEVRTNGCKAKNISCFSSCEETQEVNATTFWERLHSALHEINGNLKSSKA